MRYPRIAICAWVIAAMGLAGCASTKRTTEAPAEELRPPVVRTVNWLSPGSRIAMLPIYTTESVGAAMKDMDAIFRGALIDDVAFEVVPVSRAELQGILRREQIPSSEAIPPGLIRALQDKYDVDALLFTEFTVYRPYRPIAIGVRSKLVSMETLEVLWAAERVYDSADATTAEAAVRFADPAAVSAQRANQVILQSPRRYAGFVAHEIYATLPTQ